MAAFTTSQAGNVSSAATWGGGGTPTGGTDTVTVNHAIVQDIDWTLGTSPNDTTTNVMVLGAGGDVVQTAGKLLTLKGNAAKTGFNFAGETFLMNAGAAIRFDNTASGGNPVYQFDFTFMRLKSVGTANSRCSISAVPGTTGRITGTSMYHNTTTPSFDLAYTDTPRVKLDPTIHGDTGLSFVGVTFSACPLTDLSSTGACLAGVVFRDTKWTGSTDATNSLKLTFGTTGPNRSFYNCSTDKAVSQGGLDFTVDMCTFAGIDCAAGGTLRRRPTRLLSVTDGSLNSGNGQRLPGGLLACYLVVENALGNGHHVSASTTGGADAVYEGVIFEQRYPDLIDTGDCLIVSTGATAGGGKVVGLNCIVLPGADGSSAQLLTLFNNAVTVTRWGRNTVFVGLSAAVGKRGAFAFAEGGDGAADQLELLSGNIGWSASAGGGYIGEKVGGAALDHITPAGCDRNHAWNLSAGNNTRSYANHAVNANIWTAGNAAAAGADVHQTTGDPQFVDSTRTIATWAVATGNGTDYATGKAALFANPALVQSLLDHVTGGFAVRYATLRTGYLGMPVGAGNFHDDTRTGAGVTAAKALLAPHLAA